MRTIPNGIDLPAALALAGSADGVRLRQQHGIGRHEDQEPTPALLLRPDHSPARADRAHDGAV
jgi:hypothetical protein